MLRFTDEKELHKCGLAIDPDDSSKVVPIGTLADRQQGPTCAEGAGQDGQLPAGSGPTTKNEKAQDAPFDLDGRMMKVAALQERMLRHDRFRTVLYCRSGLELIEVKKALKALGRRDFCRCSEEHGIQPWFRKRAMQIARHFRTEEACHGIPLPEALKMSRKPSTGAQENQRTKAGRNGKSAGTPASQKPIPPKPASGPTSHAAAAGNGPAPGNGEGTSKAPLMASEPSIPPQPPITAAEIDALEAFIVAVGGLSRAEYVFERGVEHLRELNDED